jgi:diguanylate cyclase (GGDEF)-like protein
MRILIAEDDSTSRRVLEAALTKWGYQVVSTRDGNEAWAALQAEEPPPLAVLDWMMPGIGGADICRRVRAREEAEDEERYTYLILLTAKGAKEDIVAGLKAGADDYVVKPFDQHEMRVRVRAGQRIVDLHHRLHQAKQKLAVLVRTDPLTGTLNRRGILERLEAELARAAREGTALSLSLLDIDRFKRINDTYDHTAGDSVLRLLVERVTAIIRGYATVGRFGGEEFLLLIPQADAGAANRTAERVRGAVGKPPFDVDQTPIHVTVSQGVATWDGRMDLSEFIRQADDALYRAKANGRDRVEHARPAPASHAPQPAATVP